MPLALAHELRNPLQNAVGFVAELRDRASATVLQVAPEFEEFPTFLKYAHAELRRAAGIVDHLLDYVWERKPSLQPVNLCEIVGEAIAPPGGSAVRP
ncbi:MAG: histidine kinase dimerization/phospho-acceptor domain-containing protein [Anaerolineae bacterium]